jgi:hypothetical protein
MGGAIYGMIEQKDIVTHIAVAASSLASAQNINLKLSVIGRGWSRNFSQTSHSVSVVCDKVGGESVLGPLRVILKDSCSHRNIYM